MDNYKKSKWEVCGDICLYLFIPLILLMPLIARNIEHRNSEALYQQRYTQKNEMRTMQINNLKQEKLNELDPKEAALFDDGILFECKDAKSGQVKFIAIQDDYEYLLVADISEQIIYLVADQYPHIVDCKILKRIGAKE